jgi:EAL domain-containing protein (putative c-di-GMP-specific phosphodiesterase class I)
VPISVNMPVLMFLRTNLGEIVHDALAAHGLPQAALRVEITETGLMNDLQSVMPMLQRLNDIGVEISIDDFGTGYSSLSYLTTLPIAELKIDRAFVRDLGITPQSSAIVQAIVALGNALGLRVVAEGVEMLRQLEGLQRLGCALMQGYMFCRPMPAAELERWHAEAVLPGAAAPRPLAHAGAARGR